MAARARRAGAPPAEAGPRRRSRGAPAGGAGRARRAAADLARDAGPGAAPGSRTPAGGRNAPFERVYRLVRRIPRGRVMNYGQISRLLGGPLSARAVGWAMHGCPGDVPWHRVVNASGGCSSDAIGEPGLQRRLLEGEGVTFRPNGTLDLKRYRWTPRRRTPPRDNL